jgi:hypothetical protein
MLDGFVTVSSHKEEPSNLTVEQLMASMETPTKQFVELPPDMVTPEQIAEMRYRWKRWIEHHECAGRRCAQCRPDDHD